eukprot:5821399-Alexandrium_andersonii.AAC.1
MKYRLCQSCAPCALHVRRASGSEVNFCEAATSTSWPLARSSGVVWCGVVWCGVVWCGVVWCGAVWCGVA